MKQLISIFRRFLSPYWGYMALDLVFNMLGTVLSLFSFAAIIPILKILFGAAEADLAYQDMAAVNGMAEWAGVMKNNLFWWIQEQIAVRGSGWVLMMLGLFLITATGLKCMSSYLALYFMVPIRTGVLRDLRKSLFRKVLSLPVGFFTEEHKGDIMSRMTADVSEVESSIMASLDVVFKDPVMILIYLVTLFCLSWQLTLFVLILLPTAGWLIGRIGRSLKRQSRHGQEQTGEILTQIEESLAGLRVVKAFNAEEKQEERFGKVNEDTRTTFNRIYRRYYLAHPVSEFLGTALIAVLLWYGGGLILADHSTIDAAEFIYYLVIFYSIINPAKDLSKAAYSIRKGMASIERIDRILDTPSEQIEPSLPVDKAEKDAAAEGAAGKEEPLIEYDGVSFAYRQDVDVLQDINVKIYRGQTVAFVGQSGSGKTTLVDLLPRFYDVQSGTIRVNGKDVREYNLHSLRSKMGIVSQEPFLFNDTVAANIAFATEEEGDTDENGAGRNAEKKVSAESIMAAAKAANAYDFIMATPDGFETTVGDRGSRLSGGQRQRISIARAILKNPEILILDEATSALDTESEKLVQEALDNLMRNRTTLVIAHRLSTIKNADLICVLHEGRIVERGKHEELLAQGGYYAKLISMQQ